MLAKEEFAGSYCRKSEIWRDKMAFVSTHELIVLRFYLE